MDKFFKQNEPVNFDYPEKIDFQNKVFHLSGNFLGGKKEFAEKLEPLGAKCRGINHEAVSLKNTNYFVLADAGVKEAGKHKPNGGNKVQKVQEYNNKHKKIMIQILQESHCIKLIDDYKKEYLSTPKPKP